MHKSVLLVIVLLAGCTDDASPETPGPRPDPAPGPDPVGPQPTEPDQIPMLLDFSYTSCDGVVATHHPEISLIQAQLPDNRTAAVTQQIGPMSLGSVEVWMSRCDSLSTANSEVAGPAYGHSAVLLDDQSWYILSMFAEEGTILELWTAAGYEVREGTYTVGSGTPGQWSFGGYQVDGVATGGQQTVQRERVQVFDHDAGVLDWRGDVDITRQVVAGQLSLPADDPFGPVTNVEMFAVSGDMNAIDLILYLE